MDSLTEKILKRLTKTPAFEAAKVEEVEAHLEDRKAKAADIPRINAERTKALVPLRKVVEATTATLEKAQRAMIAAQGEHNKATIAVHNVDYAADAKIQKIEVDLRASAIPGIRTFVDSLSERWDHERRRWEWMAPRDKNNVPLAAKDRNTQINDIRKQAQELYLEPDPEVAEAELAKLKADLDAPMSVAAA